MDGILSAISEALTKALSKPAYFLIATGLIVYFVSFVQYNQGFHFPTPEPIMFLLWPGLIIALLGIIVLLTTLEPVRNKAEVNTYKGNWI